MIADFPWYHTNNAFLLISFLIILVLPTQKWKETLKKTLKFFILSTYFSLQLNKERYFIRVISVTETKWQDSDFDYKTMALIPGVGLRSLHCW